MSSKSEEWKDITGYEGLYQVSTLGNVRSYNKLLVVEEVKHAWSKVKY